MSIGERLQGITHNVLPALRRAGNRITTSKFIQMQNRNSKVDGSTSASLEQNGLLSAVYLFLDDIREPEHAFEYTKQEMFLKQKWEVVRNFDEFKSFIENNGLPTFISFDHDLADTHYTPEPLWTDYEKSKEWQDKQIHKEKTGYECAKWLVEYCIGNKLKCPGYYCHSMNPVGKDKIVGLLRSFSNSR